MAAKSNQESERQYFERFRKFSGLLNGQLTDGHRPGPDIIIDDGQRRVGVEVTNFYLENGELPESEQKQRNYREKVLNQGHRMYMAGGGRYRINFSFNKQQPIRNCKKLAQKIVDLIRSIEGKQTGQIPKDLIKENILELDYIYIYPNLYSDPEWHNVQSHSNTGKTMSVKTLEQILRGKERKAEEYKKCDAY